MLKLVPLSKRRKVHTVILVKKCLLGFVPPYLYNYFEYKLNESRSRYNLQDKKLHGYFFTKGSAGDSQALILLYRHFSM